MTTQQQTILGLAIGLPLFFLILLGILVACCWKKVKNWLIVRLTNKKRKLFNLLVSLEGEESDHHDHVSNVFSQITLKNISSFADMNIA